MTLPNASQVISARPRIAQASPSHAVRAHVRSAAVERVSLALGSGIKPTRQGWGRLCERSANAPDDHEGEFAEVEDRERHRGKDSHLGRVPIRGKKRAA